MMNSGLLESRKAKNYNSTSLKYSYQYFTTMTVLSDKEILIIHEQQI